ncbi:MAG: AgmX/PglI C-terminal domain-containing protein [Bdellovibrionales bacterium]
MVNSGFEVQVTWQGRLISARFFSGVNKISVGGANADLALPVFDKNTNYDLMLPLHLEEGQSASVKVRGGLLDLVIRRLYLTAKPKADRVLDLSSGETIGLLLALVISGVLSLLTKVTRPELMSETESRVENRIARIVFKKPRPTAPKTVKGPTAKDWLKRLQGFTPDPNSSLIAMAGSSTGQGGRTGEIHIGGTLQGGPSGAGAATVGPGKGGGPRGRQQGRVGGLGPGGIGTRSSGAIQIQESGASEVLGMDREAIRRVIREHLREIRNCYEARLQSNPELHGKVVLQWNIVGAGQVKNARVTGNSLGDSAVGDCLARRLSTWTFPSPPQDQIGQVVYPFVFSAR